MNETQRIDKWLWCVRLFKTRTQAAEACTGGKVKLNDATVKPSRELKPGDVVSMKRGIITWSYRVLDFPKNRVSAKEVAMYAENITPETEKVKMDDLKYIPVIKREKGSGRPTKKERRDLGKFLTP